MSNGIELVWHDASTAEIRNNSGQVLTQVRIQVVGETRVAGRREWTHDVDSWGVGTSVRMVRIEPRGLAPQVRLRFHVGNSNLTSRQWFTDVLPLTRPDSILERDPRSLAARMERSRHQP